MTPKERIIPLFIPHEGCPHRCAFCNQHTIAGSAAAPTPAEAEAIIEAGVGAAGGKAEVAFYGGSFTAIPREKMRAYLQITDRFITAGKVSGVRVSTRPDAVDAEILAELKTHGVTLVELGAQSMQEDVLAVAARGHTAGDVRKAAQEIHKTGITLGLQMMTGLPLDDDEKAVLTARDMIALSPAVVRIYPTLVLPGTALAALYRAGRYQPQSLEGAASLAATLYQLFHEAHIRVIRMGVNESEGLSAQVEAGPYHPAFGELVLAECYKRKAEELLTGRDLREKELVLRVPAGDESKMAGQERKNVEYLKRVTGAKRIRINPRTVLQDEVFVCI